MQRALLRTMKDFRYFADLDGAGMVPVMPSVDLNCMSQVLAKPANLLVTQVHYLRCCSEVFPEPCRSYPVRLKFLAKTSQYVPGLEMGLAPWKPKDVRVVIRNKSLDSVIQQSVNLLFHLKC